MADPRFFIKSPAISLANIVALTGAELLGDYKEIEIADVAPLDKAAAGHISFLDNIKYAGQFKESKAAACFIRKKHITHAPAGMILLVSENPYLCYAITAQAFYLDKIRTASVSPNAYIAESAKIGASCTIEANSFIGENVEIGSNCYIGAGAVIQAGSVVGDNSAIGANSTISHSIIGKNVIIHRGVHIGQDGFGFAVSPRGLVKVPQLGRVIIEDDVEIGSGTCIDRGAGPDTLIGQGTKIDNLVQIGHNVQIGKHSVVVAQVGIAGSSHIGNGVMLGGQVGVVGHVKVGDNVKVAAQSGVMGDLPAGASYGGSPAVPIKDWHRQTLALSKSVKRKETENE